MVMVHIILLSIIAKEHFFRKIDFKMLLKKLFENVMYVKLTVFWKILDKNV